MAFHFRSLALALAALWFAKSCCGQVSSGAGRKEILILNSYHSGYNWTDELNRGIRSVLEAQSFETEIWVEFLDTRRRPGAEHLTAEGERLRRKYGSMKLDLIISSYDDAAALLGGAGAAMCMRRSNNRPRTAA